MISNNLGKRIIWLEQKANLHVKDFFMETIFEKGEKDELMRRQEIRGLKKIHESRMPMFCVAVIRATDWTLQWPFLRCTIELHSEVGLNHMTVFDQWNMHRSDMNLF